VVGTGAEHAVGHAEAVIPQLSSVESYQVRIKQAQEEVIKATRACQEARESRRAEAMAYLEAKQRELAEAQRVAKEQSDMASKAKAEEKAVKEAANKLMAEKAQAEAMMSTAAMKAADARSKEEELLSRAEKARMMAAKGTQAAADAGAQAVPAPRVGVRPVRPVARAARRLHGRRHRVAGQGAAGREHPTRGSARGGTTDDRPPHRRTDG